MRLLPRFRGQTGDAAEGLPKVTLIREPEVDGDVRKRLLPFK